MRILETPILTTLRERGPSKEWGRKWVQVSSREGALGNNTEVRFKRATACLWEHESWGEKEKKLTTRPSVYPVISNTPTQQHLQSPYP